jgi:alpha-D-ribose 1-methylphosphonate 5-triphosphate synthase subunit PhnG
MTMIQAEDSVEFQPFYLGEALTTDCELTVNGCKGYGICLGDEPTRCYCMAFIDAVLRLEGVDLQPVYDFLNEQGKLIDQARTIEFNHIQRTKVDFKLMEED